MERSYRAFWREPRRRREELHYLNRAVKFSEAGTFIKAWGKTGTAPGELDLPHSIAIDSRRRLFVGDRSIGPNQY